MCYDQPDFRSYKGIESRGIIKRKEESLEERVRWKSFEVCLRLLSRLSVGHKSCSGEAQPQPCVLQPCCSEGQVLSLMGWLPLK